MEVGERVQVVFKNKATRPYSVNAHGVKTREKQLAPVSPGKTQTAVTDALCTPWCSLLRYMLSSITFMF